MTTKKSRPTPRRSGRRRRPRRSRAVRIVLWMLALGVLALALGTVAVTATLAYFARDLPTVSALRDYDPPETTRILDRKGRLIAEVFEERRTVVDIDRIPRVLVLCVLAAEDADFYGHEGLDYAGIVRALFRDVLSGRPAQGASTITQQIVKNVLLTPERTVSRKIRELILARRLEQELSKDEILYLYLNHINFGHGRYGVQEASRFYFDKDVEDLTLAEASLIAGIPKAPSHFSPLRHPEAARRRQAYVLRQLEAKRELYWNDLSPQQIQAARDTPPQLAERDSQGLDAPEVLTLVKQRLAEQLGAEELQRGGYTVRTSVDLDLQRAAREALRQGLASVDERHKRRGPLAKPNKRRRKRTKRLGRLSPGRTYDATVVGRDDEQGTLELDIGGHRAVANMERLERFNPEGLPPSEFAPLGARARASVLSLGEGDEPARAELELGPDGAVVVIDPRTRELLALVGGERASFGFNRAWQAERQPGSAFKPIVYALGLRSRRYTPASLVLDAPEVFDEWKPDNYETWHYEGAVRLREALAKSINLVAVRVARELTPEAIVDFARELGISTELEPSLALALGASVVRPVELVNAYATFAAAGRYAPPRLITEVRDADGQPVALPRQAEARTVMTPAEAYVLTSMLESVVEEGTGKGAQALERPAAGKTGTSNRARDAWFVGYTPDMVAGVWVGFDDHRSLGRKESGGRTALPIWVDVMRAAVGDRRPADFPVPDGVVTAEIDPESGLLAYEGMEETLEEVFLAGTAPTETAQPADVLDANSFLLEQLGAQAAPQPPPEESSPPGPPVRGALTN